MVLENVTSYCIVFSPRISYSVYELKRLKEGLVSKPDLRLVIMYDIACLLSSHLKVRVHNIYWFCFLVAVHLLCELKKSKYTIKL